VEFTCFSRRSDKQSVHRACSAMWGRPDLNRGPRGPKPRKLGNNNELSLSNHAELRPRINNYEGKHIFIVKVEKIGKSLAGGSSFEPLGNHVRKLVCNAAWVASFLRMRAILMDTPAFSGFSLIRTMCPQLGGQPRFPSPLSYACLVGFFRMFVGAPSI